MLSRYFARDLFAGRTVFVTGGGGTINVAIAKGMGELGAKVVLAGRTMERLEACRDELRAAGIEATALYVDVQDITTIDAALAETEALYGPVDVLVCGAAANFPAPA